MAAKHVSDDAVPARQASLYAKVFAIAATAIVGLLAVRVLAPVGAPLAWAILIAFLMWPLNVRLRRRLKGSRGRAALCTTFCVLVGLAGPITLIGVAFIRQATELLDTLPATIRKLSAPGALRFPWLERTMAWLEDTVGVTPRSLGERALGAAAEALQLLVSRLGTVFVGAVGVVTGLALAFFVLYFVLRDGEAMLRGATGLLPLDEQRRNDLTRRLGDVTRALVLGSLATAAAQGTLVGLAFAILDLPSPVVFGVLSAIVSVLPIGTALVWFPVSLVLIVLGRYGAAAFLVLWGVFIVSVVDNLIRPRIVSGRADVSTLLVFLGILGGIASFGLIGVFVGPLVLVLARELARFFTQPA